VEIAENNNNQHILQSHTMKILSEIHKATHQQQIINIVINISPNTRIWLSNILKTA